MPVPAVDDQRAVLAMAGDIPAIVRVLQVLGFGDVIPNDYFVLEIGDETPVAVRGPLFAGTFEALARSTGVA